MRCCEGLDQCKEVLPLHSNVVVLRERDCLSDLGRAWNQPAVGGVATRPDGNHRRIAIRSGRLSDLWQQEAALGDFAESVFLDDKVVVEGFNAGHVFT